jgi:hypothetical protein
MKGHRLLHVLKVMVIVAVAVVVFGLVTMHLWNWLMPMLFGFRAITFGQAIGLLVLSKILFGGFRGRGGSRRGWRRDMQEKWAHMSPEERERMRAGMRGRWGCGFGPEREAAPGEKPAV